MDTNGEEKESRIKETAVLLTMGGEATNLKNTEDLYASLWSRVIEEEDSIPFPDWKVGDEYQDPVDPKLLLTNFAAVLPEVTIPLNYHVE